MGFLVQLSSLNILLAGVAALTRFTKIERNFLPFFALIWLGCGNELLSVSLIHYGYQTAVNNNVYVLLEALLITYFFRQTRLLIFHRWVYLGLYISFGAFWAVENLVIGNLYSISSYFRIFYSLIVVLLSIELVNTLAFEEKKSLLRNPLFLIGIAFIVFYTFKMLVEAFWIYRLTSSLYFLKALFIIVVGLNFIVNFVFFLVVLWIPKRQESILLY